MSDGNVSHGYALQRGFEVLIETQGQLQQAMGWPNGHGVECAKNALLHTHAEVSEVLAEINWKPHKKNQPGYGELKDRAKFVMEITDVFQTLTNAALAYDVTAEELAAALVAKWEINFQNVLDGMVTREET